MSQNLAGKRENGCKCAQYNHKKGEENNLLTQDKIASLERQLAKVQNNLNSKESLIKIQTDQLKKMEDMYKKCLDENSNLNYLNKKALHDLENLKIILKQYEEKSITTNQKNTVCVKCNLKTSEVTGKTSIGSTDSDKYNEIRKVLKLQDVKIETIISLFKEMDNKSLSDDSKRSTSSQIVDAKKKRTVSQISDIEENILMKEIKDLRDQLTELRNVKNITVPLVSGVCNDAEKFVNNDLKDKETNTVESEKLPIIQNNTEEELTLLEEENKLLQTSLVKMQEKCIDTEHKCDAVKAQMEKMKAAKCEECAVVDAKVSKLKMEVTILKEVVVMDTPTEKKPSITLVEKLDGLKDDIKEIRESISNQLEQVRDAIEETYQEEIELKNSIINELQSEVNQLDSKKEEVNKKLNEIECLCQTLLETANLSMHTENTKDTLSNMLEELATKSLSTNFSNEIQNAPIKKEIKLKTNNTEIVKIQEQIKICKNIIMCVRNSIGKCEQNQHELNEQLEKVSPPDVSEIENVKMQMREMEKITKEIVKNCEDQIERKEREIEELQRNSKNAIKKSNCEIRSMQEKIEELQCICESKQEEIEKLKRISKESNHSKKALMENMEKEFQEAQMLTEFKQEQIDILEQNLIEASQTSKADQENMEKKYEALQCLCEYKQEHIEILEQKLNEADVENMKGKIEQLQCLCDTYESESKSSKKIIDILEISQAATENEVQTFKEESKSLKYTIGELENNISILKTKLSEAIACSCKLKIKNNRMSSEIRSENDVEMKLRKEISENINEIKKYKEMNCACLNHIEEMSTLGFASKQDNIDGCLKDIVAKIKDGLFKECKCNGTQTRNKINTDLATEYSDYKDSTSRQIAELNEIIEKQRNVKEDEKPKITELKTKCDTLESDQNILQQENKNLKKALKEIEIKCICLQDQIKEQKEMEEINKKLVGNCKHLEECLKCTRDAKKTIEKDFVQYHNNSEELKEGIRKEILQLKKEIENLESGHKEMYNCYITNKKLLDDIIAEKDSLETEYNKIKNNSALPQKEMKKIISECKDYKLKLDYVSREIEMQMAECVSYKKKTEQIIQQLKHENYILKSKVVAPTVNKSAQCLCVVAQFNENTNINDYIAELEAFIAIKNEEINQSTELIEKTKELLRNASEYKNAQKENQAQYCYTYEVLSDDSSSANVDLNMDLLDLQSKQARIQSLITKLSKQNEEFLNFNKNLIDNEEKLTKRLKALEQKKNYLMDDIDTNLNAGDDRLEDSTMDDRVNTPVYCCPHKSQESANASQCACASSISQPLPKLKYPYNANNEVKSERTKTCRKYDCLNKECGRKHQVSMKSSKVNDEKIREVKKYCRRSNEQNVDKNISGGPTEVIKSLPLPSKNSTDQCTLNAENAADYHSKPPLPKKIISMTTPIGSSSDVPAINLENASQHEFNAHITLDSEDVPIEKYLKDSIEVQRSSYTTKSLLKIAEAKKNDLGKGRDSTKVKELTMPETKNGTWRSENFPNSSFASCTNKIADDSTKDTNDNTTTP